MLSNLPGQSNSGCLLYVSMEHQLFYLYHGLSPSTCDKTELDPLTKQVFLSAQNAQSSALTADSVYCGTTVCEAINGMAADSDCDDT